MCSQRSTNVGVGANLRDGGNTTGKDQDDEPDPDEPALDQGCFSSLKLVYRKIKNKCKKCFKKWAKKLRKTTQPPAQGSTETSSSNTTVPDIIESGVPVSHPPTEVQINQDIVDDIIWEDFLSAEGSPAPLPDTCEVTYQTLGDLITFENLMGEGKPIMFYDIFEEYCKETEGLLPSYDAGMLLAIRGRPISNNSEDQDDEYETDIPPANAVFYSVNPIDPSSTTAA